MSEDGQNQEITTSVEVLSWEQISKLDTILSETKIIHGRRNFPSIEICIKDFIRNLRHLLIKNGVCVDNIRINGGVASYVIADGDEYQYSDIDIIFGCKLVDNNNNNSQDYFDLIKESVFQYLISLMQVHLSKDKISTCMIKEAYVTKLIKVNEKQDAWSLISLNNDYGQNIELKFVDKMRRQFQFSVDSFQIHLDTLLQYYDYQDLNGTSQNGELMSRNFYPSVQAKSVYGNFKEAKYHLDNKQIATKTPEEMRGGGLLKYCNLLIRGFEPHNKQINAMQERYMCSRFFIDFKDINSQNITLGTYLHTHFFNNPFIQYHYLLKLYEIVKRSTVCLMNHERQMTLNLINSYIDICKNVLSSYHHQYQMQLYNYFQQQHYANNTNTNTDRPNTLDIPTASSSSGCSSATSSICCSPVSNTSNINDNIYRGYIPQNAKLGIEILSGCFNTPFHASNVNDVNSNK